MLPQRFAMSRFSHFRISPALSFRGDDSFFHDSRQQIGRSTDFSSYALPSPLMLLMPPAAAIYILSRLAIYASHAMPAAALRRAIMPLAAAASRSFLSIV